MKKILIFVFFLCGIYMVNANDNIDTDATSNVKNSETTLFSVYEENISIIYLANNPRNCICPRCEVVLRSEQRTEEGWVSCRHCGGDGLVTGLCRGCESCRECEQTGKQRCRSNDGSRMGRFTHCRDCTVCRGTGWRDVMKPNHTGCRDCGGNDRVAGKGGRMQIVRRYTILSCPRCRTDYDGC